MTTGILLINLGTPNNANVKSVKRYLREFLTDKKVIDLPNPWRSLLVNGIIIPRRAKQSTHAYQQIWTAEGSPLMVHSVALAESLQTLLSNAYQVSLGMNYGSPSILEALDALKACDKIVVLPLFPQYSDAVTGSILGKIPDESNITIIKDFFDHPAFIEAKVQKIQPILDQLQPEYLVLSYHGLPVRQLHKTSGDICKTCMNQPCHAIQVKNRYCYRSQCYETSRLIAEQLSLNNTAVITTFQSRLGRLEWTRPYTESVLNDLRQKGVKRIAIACPSFVTDCLETLEEIGIRAKNKWLEEGGEAFELIPALNNTVDYLGKILQ